MRHTRTLAATLFAAATLAVVTPKAEAANLVSNGDFDNIGNVFVNNTGLGSDDSQSSGATNIPGWTNVPGFTNEFWANTPNSYGLTQSPGNGSTYWVDLTGQANNKPYGGIEQNISTVAGGTYTLTFDLGASTLYNTSGLGAAALTASVTGAAVDASQLFTLAPTGSDEWQSETLTFVADAASTTIKFLADSSYTSQYTGLDNVSVVLSATPPTQTPEPASWTLLGAAVVALGLVGLKGRQAL